MTGSKILRHVVMMGFKEGTTTAEIDEIIRRFGGLQHEVPDIDAFECGENNSPEGLNDGLSHCFLLTFATEAARDAYLPHPNHKAFAGWVGQWVAKVVVVDYWAGDAP
ncbi:MAG: Dabb family protein [Geminicoccaceae bacterium]